MINPTKLTTPKDAFDAMGVSYAFSRGYAENATTTNGALLREALEGAKQFQKVLVFAGLTDYVESEGCDREDMRLPENQLALIEGLIKENKQVIVVLFGGSPGAAVRGESERNIEYVSARAERRQGRARICCSERQTPRAGLQRPGCSDTRTFPSAKRSEERERDLQRERLRRLPLLYDGAKESSLSRFAALLHELCLVGYAVERGRGSVHHLLPREKYGNTRWRGSRSALCLCA